MKNTKTRYILFSFYDRTWIEAYLEKQAEEGWLLDNISVFGWHFHRIEPQKLHFSVTYFPNASAFSYGPSEQQQEYQELCAHTGWKFTASNAQMQIFYNEAEHPTPIETDAVLEVASIHASVKKSILPSYYLLAGVGLLQMILLLFRLFSDPISVLANNANLFSGFCWILNLFLSLSEIVGYYRWYRRAKKTAELDGSFVETKGHRTFQIAILCALLLGFAFLLISYCGDKITMIAFATVGGIFAITAIVIAFCSLMKKLKLSTKLNRILTIMLTLVLSCAFTAALLFCVISNITNYLPKQIPADTYEFNNWVYNVYRDELPLTVEDLIETDYDEYSYRKYSANSSVLVEQQTFRQSPRMDALAQPELSYSVTTVKFKPLYHYCKSALLDDFAHNYGFPEHEGEAWQSHITVDSAPWGADEAYQLKLGDDLEQRFLLCYDTRIVEIDFEDDWSLTDEQMKIVGEALGK